MLHVNPDFAFFDFNPSDDLRKKAELTTKRLRDLAPYGTMVIAALRKSEELYQCTIELYSNRGPFKSVAAHEAPERALEQVARALTNKLERWKEQQNRSSHLKRLHPQPSQA